MELLRIKMLGEFSLQMGENIISDNDNRTKKGWMLLAYLICHKGRVIPQKELIKLLWGDDPSSSNPENALRITFHRLRTQLDQLWPTAGRDLILYRENGYSWSEQIPVTLDFEQFDSLCHPHGQEDEARLQSFLDALALYRGDFLEKQSSEPWVIPISTHFHNLYISASMEAAALLSAKDRHQEAAAICRTAISSEPYHEPLHQTLMQELAALGNQKGAADVYEELSKKLFDDFGIRPSEETRSVYRATAHAVNDKTLPMDVVLEHLQEPNSTMGAMQCDYDYFKVLCYAESRAMERSGKATHIVLLSVTDGLSHPLSKRTLGRVMEQLGEQIRLNLRRGDTFSRCSVSQYILMLPEANYENSCMVSRRVLGAFAKKHPHVTARIQFMVQPLSSNISVP